MIVTKEEAWKIAEGAATAIIEDIMDMILDKAELGKNFVVIELSALAMIGGNVVTRLENLGVSG